VAVGSQLNIEYFMQFILSTYLKLFTVLWQELSSQRLVSARMQQCMNKTVYWIPEKCIDIAGIYHVRTANKSVPYTAAVAILAHIKS
jgi:hypothetical protein